MSFLIKALAIIASCQTEEQLKTCENLAKNPLIAPDDVTKQEIFRAIIVRQNLI